MRTDEGIIAKKRANAKKPPSLVNAEGERGCIGSIFMRPDLFVEVRAVVPAAEAFAVESCRRIYSAMLTVADEGKLPEGDAVLAHLGRVGGIDAELRGFIREVTQSMPIGDNAVPFARDVASLHRRRQIALKAERVQQLAVNDAGPESIAESVRDLAAVSEGKPRAATSSAVPIIVRMADVLPEAVRWLWPGRIALGKLTIVAGDPGLGKSFLTCDLAARVSRGLAWPDEPSGNAPRGGVVMLNCEDGLADTIRPRLDAHGADVEKIVALPAVRDPRDANRERPFDLSRDLSALESAIEQVGECRLVVVDPVTAYLGERTDSHKAADVRAVLTPLADLAARLGVAVVAVSHLNKGSGAAMYRTIGSIAFTATARAAWLVARDEGNGERRLFLPTKNNLAPDRSGLAFEIVEGVVAWEQNAVNVTADEALRVEWGDDDRTAKAEATDWLRGTLADGPVLASDVKARARADGIAPRTLDRAKVALGVDAAPDGFRGPWVWRLPDGTPGQTAPDSPECASLSSAAHSGKSGVGLAHSADDEAATRTA